MNQLEITLQQNAACFAPRAAVAGTVRWQSRSRPRRIEVALRWRTSGKGTPDTGVAESLTINDPATSGSRDFSLVLPEGPYSFSGRLVSLTWAVEATSFPGKETAHREIIVSPTGRLIALYGSAPESEGAAAVKG